MFEISPMFACGPSGDLLVLLGAVVVGMVSVVLLAVANLTLITILAVREREWKFAVIHFLVSLIYSLPAWPFFRIWFGQIDFPLSDFILVAPLAVLPHFVYLLVKLRRVARVEA